LSQEKTFIKWWHNKFEKEKKVTKQFEKDNLFYIDKKVWNEIKREKICLKHKGKVINQKKYKYVKTKIKRGVKMGYRDMLKIRKFIKYSVIGSIDKDRVNIEYIKLLKEMKISNRVEK
jgi:hypothetical protein